MTKFNDDQLDRLSEFTANLAVVQFASVVAPIFTNSGGGFNLIMIILGLILMFGFLSMSLFLER